MIDHRGALNTILDINDRYAVACGDAVLGLSNLNFDLSVYDIFGVLGAGGVLVLPHPEQLRDPHAWLALLQAHRVTLWNTVPALAQMLAEVAPPDSVALRVIMLSGDWIPLDLPARLARLAPRARRISMGGATEASIWSISYEIGATDPAWRSVPYGRAMANQQFYVLDADGLTLAPVGVPGALYIGGIGVALGYWRDPALTAASFVRHPRTGAQLYRTGDMGRLLADGNIEFLGRLDHQVKLNGFRIEPGEIEARLRDYPGVLEAVVQVRTEAGGERRLVAYLVPSEQTELEPAALRAHLADQLPVYMVPSTASWIARRCRLRPQLPATPARTRRKTRRKWRSPPSGSNCSGMIASGATATFSCSAATRCWRCRRSARCSRPGWRFRSASCSVIAVSTHWRRWSASGRRRLATLRC
jgi:acyl-coenzyme A synthetase/AMP-(fatty) acid ligase